MEKSKKIVINWFYEKEDEDAMEEGEDFKIVNPTLDFNLVEKDE